MSVFVSEKYDRVSKAAQDLLSREGCSSILSDGRIILPGFSDVHVHLREPGFSYKETIRTGTMAAARGGYTAVCTMPNLKPAPDSLINLKKQTDIIKRDAVIRVFPYGTITRGERGEELSDMEELKPYVCAFSDDGRGVQSADMMKRAMEKAASLGTMIVAHCEVNSLLNGGYIHDGVYAAEHGHRGICSESEWAQVERDVELAEETGCAYHVCHVSTKESVEIIRNAKRKGVDVTCETAPHYLLFCDEEIRESGSFKMNPPIRGRADRDALIEGIKDGTVDMIATDHAPHSAEEKAGGLKDSLNGIVGLETAFPVLYTGLVKKGIISLEELVELLSDNPKKRFNIDTGTDFTVIDIKRPYVIDPDEFLSKGRATPFAGREVFGRTVMTVCRDSIVYRGE
ncbi:MAG: dihydroorotase [Lachnospiraceae bacterium]|nr:dihydroorotase [Lachnospiraceae bacterium]